MRREYMAKTGKTDRGGARKRPSGKSDRIVAIPKADRYSHERLAQFQEGQCVELWIGDSTEIGYRAVINDSGEGLLYKNEVFQPLRRGQRIAGFIKKVRDDGKIDLCLQKPGPEKVDDVAARIIDELKVHGGVIALTDKSPSEDIYRLFGASKKTYKKAIGSLYRKRIIVIEDTGIRLARRER